MYTQTTERLWRKNRQTLPGSSCIGRDINRNWPYQWDVPGGASSDPCDLTFRGTAPWHQLFPSFSLISKLPIGTSPGDSTELPVLSSYLNRLAADTGVRLYIDFHSYSQLFMTRMSSPSQNVSFANSHFLWQHTGSLVLRSQPTMKSCRASPAVLPRPSVPSMVRCSRQGLSVLRFIKSQEEVWTMFTM